ncbi:MAG: acyltransferase family protein [Acidimicrobiales bacterium]
MCPSSSQVAATRRLGHVPGLDGMRGIAVIIVVAAHLNVFLPIPEIIVVPGGTVSLDSFFVLSGFLITVLLLKEQGRSGTVNKRAFYQRRALRLLPALLAVVIAHMIFAWLSGVSWDLERSSVLSVVFYYSNWKMAFAPETYLGGGVFAPGLQHLWSLSMEEQFYLLWPFVVVFFLGITRSFKVVTGILIALIAVIAIHRGLEYHSGMRWYPIFVRTDSRVDAILIGALLGNLWARHREPTRYLVPAAWIASAFLLICMPLARIDEPFLYYGGLVLIDLACATIILALVEGKWVARHLFNVKILVTLGLVSYGIYLWHLPVFFAVEYWGKDWPSPVQVTVALGATAMFTALSWFLLEKPALNLKNRLEGRPTSSSPTMVTADDSTSPVPQTAAAPSLAVDPPVPPTPTPTPTPRRLDQATPPLDWSRSEGAAAEPATD